MQKRSIKYNGYIESINDYDVDCIIYDGDEKKVKVSKKYFNAIAKKGDILTIINDDGKVKLLINDHGNYDIKDIILMKERCQIRRKFIGN